MPPRVCISRDGESGVLVPYGDSQAFVNAAVNLAHRPQSLIQMRHEARAHASFLDWQHVVNRFATLLIGALERQPRDEVASDRLQLATDARYT